MENIQRCFSLTYQSINQSSIAYLSLNILNLALKLKIYLRYSQKQNVSSLFSGDASMNHIQSKRNTIIDRAAILYSIQCQGFCDTFGWLLLSTGQPKAVLVVVSQTQHTWRINNSTSNECYALLPLWSNLAVAP